MKMSEELKLDWRCWGCNTIEAICNQYVKKCCPECKHGLLSREDFKAFVSAQADKLEAIIKLRLDEQVYNAKTYGGVETYPAIDATLSKMVVALRQAGETK